jgi:hypothetical protein
MNTSHNEGETKCVYPNIKKSWQKNVSSKIAIYMIETNY